MLMIVKTSRQSMELFLECLDRGVIWLHRVCLDMQQTSNASFSSTTTTTSSLEPPPPVAIWSIGSTGGNVGGHASLEALVDKLDRTITGYESFDLSKTHSLSSQDLVKFFIDSLIHSFIMMTARESFLKQKMLNKF